MRLGDLLDVSVLERLARANYNANGMPIGIIDAVDGAVLVAFGWQDICVMFHRANPVSAERCRQSDEYIHVHLSEAAPCEYTCRNGLRDIGVPIRVGGEHVATLFLGQFFYEGESPDRDFFVRQARELGFEGTAYLAALDRVPMFSRTSVENILAYNVALARIISDLAEGSLRRREAEVRAESLARFPKENPDPVLRLASDFTVLYANDAACSALRSLGMSPGKPAPAAIADVARRARSRAERIRADVASGDRSFSICVVPVGSEVNVYAQDITARELAEAALDRERSLLTSVMHATDVMLAYLDPDFNCVWVNAAYAATCNMRPDEMVGKNIFVLYPHVENEAIFRRARDSGEPVFYKDKPFEFPDQPNRGTRYWEWSLVPVRDASAIVQGLVLSVRETTSYKRAELELQAERMRWQGVVEGIADEVWVCDANGKMSLINLPEVTSMGLREFEDKTVHEVHGEVEILYPDGRPRPPEEAPLLRSLRTGEIVRGEEQMRHRASGRLRHRQFSCAPTRDATGTITGAVAIVRDITDSKRAEAALREADLRKNEFLAMLAHELRNPLAPMRTALHIVENALGSGAPGRALETLQRQVTHLARLVDDLLDVSRITRGMITVHKAPLDLAEVTRRASEDHRPVFANAGVELALEVPMSPVPVEGDETRLTQVVGNLMQNAAKFTPRGGRALVTVEAAGDRARLRVRDTGVGLDPATRDRLFQPFTQADRTLARSRGGLGLGLSLVKGIVDLHGGTAEARSDGPGRGSEFIVELPLRHEVPRARPTEPARSPARSLRVLVVEDNEDAAETLRLFLEMEGHVVEVARDGNEGIRKSESFAPEVVLCDIGLPGKDGYEVARELRRNANGATPVLVAVTGYAAPEDVKRAAAAGFDHHVAKPADMELVRQILASAVG